MRSSQASADAKEDGSSGSPARTLDPDHAKS
jgi:hypothetical protein